MSSLRRARAKRRIFISSAPEIISRGAARRGDADPAALAAASLFPSLPRDLKRANLNLATVDFALLTSGGPSR
jgi:hypothetical protein